MKNHYLTAAVLSAVFATAACVSAAATVELAEAQNGKTITLRAGDALSIRLAAQMGTGFGWQWREDPHFKLEKKELQSAASAPGGAEFQVFHVRAIEAGRAQIHLEYRQPWDKESRPQKTFEVTVDIKH